MSALSIPPSQKTNVSVVRESIHNYANVLNPVTFVEADQYSVVAVYTEVEVAASEVDEETVESAEIQVHTDFYEEEIEAVSTATGTEETVSLRPEEASETVDVAKALETLTKTFALRKESLGQDVLPGSSNASSIHDEAENATDDGKPAEEHETIDQSDDKQLANAEEAKGDFQNGGIESNIDSSCTDLKDRFDSSSVYEEMTDNFTETQPSSSSANIRRSSRLHMQTTPSRQKTSKFKWLSKEVTEDPKRYNMISDT